MQNELKEFFGKVLQIPHETIKEFIFDKKRYRKYDMINETIFWSVDEWQDGEWEQTNIYVMTNLRMMNRLNYPWFHEFDIGDDFDDVEIAPEPINPPGTHLIDL